MVHNPIQSLKLRPAQAAASVAFGAAVALSGYLWGPAGFAWAGTILALALSWAAAVDIDRFILPYILTIGLAVLGLALAATQGASLLLHHAAGATLGYLALAGVAFAYRRFRGREGLGMGDAKLMAAAGAWLGARVYRVHNIGETRQTLDMVSAIKGTRPPKVARRGLA